MRRVGVFKVLIAAVCLIGLLWSTAAARAPEAAKGDSEDKKEGAQIEQAEVKVETVIERETLEKLPKGRDYTSILHLVPGVNDEPLFNGISINGASSAENLFFIDSADTTGLYTGEPGLRVNFDFIEDVEVKTAGISAQYAGSTGGVINVVTRSGSNEFHGSAILYVGGSGLAGSPRPSLRLNPLNYKEAQYIAYPEDSWSRWESGFTLGGYIVKDRLWFFAGLMPTFMTTEREVADTFSRRDRYTNGLLKLTAQPAKNLRLSVSGLYDWHDYEGELPPLDGSGDYRDDWSAYSWKYPGLSVSGSLDYFLGERLTLNLRAGYWRTNRIQGVRPDGPRREHRRSGYGYSIPEVPYYWVNYPYVSGYVNVRDISTRLTAAADLTFYLDLAGEHAWKIGFLYVRRGIDKFDAYPYDFYRFYWGEDYESPTLGTVPTTLGYVEVRDPFGTIVDNHSHRLAVYLQDDWTIGKRLTLNLGVRLEKEDIPSSSDVPGYTDPIIRFGFGDKIAPRLGFVYDILGSGDLKVFGSCGVYYDTMKLLFPQSLGGFKWVSHFYDIVDPHWLEYTETDHPVVGGLRGGRYIETINRRIPDLSVIQPDLKPFGKREFSLGLQKNLGSHLVLGAVFVYNSIQNAIEDLGLQIPGAVYLWANPDSDWIEEIYREYAAQGLIPPGAKISQPVRNYTAFTLSLDKKFSHCWLGGISYTWSRLYGNYSGLVSSDDPGSQEINSSDYFDAWYLSYNQYGEEELGLLRSDRTHQFKLYGAYAFDFGLTVGVTAFAMSGIPVQTEVYLNGFKGWYPLGRGNLGRAPFLWWADAYIEYNLKLSDAFTLQLNLNVTNLTDNDTARQIYQLYNQGRLYVDEQTILDGFDALQSILDKGVILDPRYRMEYDYLPPIAARLGLKLLF
jgi:hypothetical protein